MDQNLLSPSNRNKRLADWALLLLLTLACYWPFTFSVFSAKNDNIIAFLPLRYNISEAIRSGNFPFWSPYIYMGFPMHSDMQSGCWNPFVWIFSLLGRYNLTMLHAEILLYIFIAGISMRSLLQSLRLDRQVCIIGAAAYMMSGFVTDVGGSNISFLAAVSFIPFVFKYYLLFLRDASFKSALKTSLSLCLLFLTSYPSFFILTCYVLLTGLIVSVVTSYKKTGVFASKRSVLNHAAMILCFLVICAPAIISYWELLPFYRRGTAVTLQMSQQNYFHPSSLVSLLFPTASIKDANAGTDLICRSAYFNSFILIFLAGFIWSRKKRLHYFLLAGILFFLLFSLGEFTPVHKLSYQILPLLNTFRHPANARLFVIVAAIILGCCTLNELKDQLLSRKIRWIGIALLMICIGFFVYALLYSGLPGKIGQLAGSNNSRQSFKSFLDNITYTDAILINSSLQILFLGVFIFFALRKNSLPNSMILFFLNSFLFAQLSIPFTFASKTDPAGINSLLHHFPKGYPLPDLTRSTAQNTVQTQEDYEKVGLVNFYNKKIGAPDRQITPTFMITYDSLLANEYMKKNVFSHPVAFLSTPRLNLQTGEAATDQQSSTQEGVLRATELTNNQFDFEVESGSETILCLQQVLLPNWKAYIDGRETEIHTSYIAFMHVNVPPGKHKVQFIYWPRHIIYALILSIIAIITSIVLLKRTSK
jgi:hypothetical protein